MDKHIELSYCGFEAFKVFAKKYLGIDSHPLFATIGHLLEETNITPYRFFFFSFNFEIKKEEEGKTALF